MEAEKEYERISSSFSSSSPSPATPRPESLVVSGTTMSSPGPLVRSVMTWMGLFGPSPMNLSIKRIVETSAKSSLYQTCACSAEIDAVLAIEWFSRFVVISLDAEVLRRRETIQAVSRHTIFFGEGIDPL